MFEFPNDLIAPASIYPARILDHERPVLQARELQDVGGGQVSRHDAPLLLERVEDDEVVGTLHAEGLALAEAPSGHADDRMAPDVGLARPLEVHLVEQPPGGVVVEVAVTQHDVPDRGVDELIALKGGGFERIRAHGHLQELGERSRARAVRRRCSRGEGTA